jgi:TetR/AcrR family transcriptional regulator, cholesterol catabolism regulator
VTAPGRPASTDSRSPDGARAPQLAKSQLKRLRRIVDAATQLAERGGFEGVKLRDVAEVSEVALGTLYNYFRSKEDILLFALADEVERLEHGLAAHPPAGTSPLQRLTVFFQQATKSLTRKPQFARAVLRSLASGDTDTTAKVAAFHGRMTRLIVAALRGKPVDLAKPPTAPTGTERERQMAFVLQNVWFASLVGWAGGLHSARAVADHVRTAAALMRVRASED